MKPIKRAVIDCEVYKNYFLLAAKELETGKVTRLEKFDYGPFNKKAASALMSNYQTISFNGINFDLLIIVAAINGYPNDKLKALSDSIIKGKRPAWMVARDHDLVIPNWDHIDLIEVAPGKSSLKIYGGRLHAPTIQDLPYEPDAHITNKMRQEISDYCVNDLDTTALLFNSLKDQIELRCKMSSQYGMDLRSKSDAQIAETIIKSELKRITGKDYRKPELPDGVRFRYRNPEIVTFSDNGLNKILKSILETRFQIGGNGSVILPQWLKEPIELSGRKYQMGIGGLHSMEKCQYVRAGNGKLLFDLDVASYYPNIILQQALAPESMGSAFLTVYQSIVDRRIKAKKEGDKVTADTLKISVNGSFGKLGSKYSPLYAPELLIQTTITGQLCLLMLIEMVTRTGAQVVSANTDGIVVYCNKAQERDVMRAAQDWELETTYTLERTDYQALASRDVNNYVAVKPDGKIKGKGCFAQSGLSKNPDFQIVFNAASEFVRSGKPTIETIKECEDMRQFVSVRRVQGGAVWRDEKLGKAVRFYYSKDVSKNECIAYATNSNKVPRSAGARPLMTLPDTFPLDIDYAQYDEMAQTLLAEIGATCSKKTLSLF